jgi:hypothetical protein
MLVLGYGNQNIYSRPKAAVSHAQGDTSFASHMDSGHFNLKMGGEVSRALPGGANVTVYKADGYAADNPLMRILTTDANGRETEQMIDPRNVKPSNATEDEILALNAYLVEQGKLDNTVYQTSILGFPGKNTGYNHFTERRNFISTVSELMLMQKNAHNMSGYAKYGKILDVYSSL